MNNFLQLAKRTLNNIESYEKIYIVLGNESCDLDSAVCALVYAYFFYDSTCNNGKKCVVPLLNICNDEFPLRTETTYFLKKNNISLDNLVFRNNISLLNLHTQGKLKLILVDHHVLSPQDKGLTGSVIEIIDHRPLDFQTNWKNVNVNVDPVGSCATLIAKIILDKKPDFLNDVIVRLLHGTIILDTVNFDTNANRFKQLDKEIVSKLEAKIKIDYTREEIFKELVSARCDVSSLTPYQILHRDMKIINGIPFPGLPMLVNDFLQLPEAEESLKQFCQSKKVKVIVVMGLVTKDNAVSRDIAIFTMKDCDLHKALIDTLKKNEEIGVNEIQKNINGLALFAQQNLCISRKHIVPMLSTVIMNFQSDITL